MRRALSLAVLLGVLCACGSSRSRDGQRMADADPAGPSAATQARSATRGQALVRGTTIEAASGRPLAGVLVEGPGAARATSDRQGRFELRGLPVGVGGELVATAPDGRTGRNVLRQLRAGALEVVVFVR